MFFGEAAATGGAEWDVAAVRETLCVADMLLCAVAGASKDCLWRAAARDALALALKARAI